MTFVDITTPKSPAGVAALLLQCKSGKRDFTPELCLDVLHATNFAKNIRDMLTMIAELPAEKQAEFKEVVLSTFERREQPNDIVILGKKLAISGGYEDELNSAGRAGVAEGEYLFSGVGKRVGIAITSFDEREDYSSYEEVFIITDDVDLRECDLSQVKNLRFREGAGVKFLGAKNLPAELDVSMCDKVDLSYCDLAPVKSLRFREGAEVYLIEATNLPEELDFSMCDKVGLQLCDLASVKNLHFREGAEVDLSCVRNLQEELDVSMCDKVDLGYCDLAQVKNLCFKDGAEVSLTNATNLPEELDVSMCRLVDLAGCDLAPVKNLRFKEGAAVDLFGAKNLPEDLDVSLCKEVDLSYCDLASVKQLRFKNPQQMEDSGAEIPDTAKVIYSEGKPMGVRILGKGGR